MKKAFFKHLKLMLVFLLVLVLLYLMTSCKAKIQYVPVESVKTEYINQYQRDSILLYDSIFVKEKNDTILMEKYKYIYRDRLKTDTLIRVDTISVAYPVEVEKEVNRLNSIQSFQIWCGRILLLILLAWGAFKLIRKKIPL